ncbi:MAG: hypothetical protein QOH26_1382 [Actinomycetota bacterium]|jgi:DMSO/TMAO reductase YedYZ molybdopterin-dependent catalytic subunit|nr:hypothetical protein [Actinomycetota bacterium]
MDASRQLGSDRDLRLAGLLATGVSVAALYVLSALTTGVPFPPTSIAEAVLRAMPGDVATFFIELLQHRARTLLMAGALVATLLFGAEVLRLTARGGTPKPFVAGGLLGVLATIAIALGPHEEVAPIAVLVSLSAVAMLYGFVARRLTGVLAQAGQGAEVDAGRRRALRLGVGGAIGIAVGGGALGWLARRLGGPDTNVALASPAERALVPERPPFPEIPGLSPEITEAADHYVVDINLVQPSVEAEGWTLGVGGLVDKPMKLTFAELQERFDVVEEFAVLTCISNEVGGDLVGNSAWGGVRMRDVLEEAGVAEGAVDVVFYGADRYSDSIPLEVAMDPSVLIAVSQNGRPLLQEHGFPCRVRIPRIYGMKNVKWLERIEVVDIDYQGYWMQRGWSDVAAVRTESRIDVPTRDTDLAPGTDAWIAGVAWAGDRGISKVEVSTNGGSDWSEAMLKEPIGRFAWTQWAFQWAPPESGDYSLACRATDGNGQTQTPDLAPPHPTGATGYHYRDVTVG